MVSHAQPHPPPLPRPRRYDDAKSLGGVVNDAKQRITEVKAAIEQRRVQRAMAGVPEGEPDPEEEAAKGAIEADKAKYKVRGCRYGRYGWYGGWYGGSASQCACGAVWVGC